MVYAPLVGREVEFSPLEQETIRDILRALNVPIICCLPPLETVKGNIDGTEQMDGVHERIEYIWKEYFNAELFGRRMSLLWFDYTDNDPTYATYDDICKRVATHLAMRKERQWTS
jgi:hypothetical protein